MCNSHILFILDTCHAGGARIEMRKANRLSNRSKSRSDRVVRMMAACCSPQTTSAQGNKAFTSALGTTLKQLAGSNAWWTVVDLADRVTEERQKQGATTVDVFWSTATRTAHIFLTKQSLDNPAWSHLWGSKFKEPLQPHSTHYPQEECKALEKRTALGGPGEHGGDASKQTGTSKLPMAEAACKARLQ